MSSVQKTLNPKYISMDDSHVKEVLDIEKESYGYPWSEKIFLDCLEYKYLCRVLMLDDVLIGYLISSIVQDECHIMNLCIKNDYRSYGYGKYLLTSLHNEIKTLIANYYF